MYALGRFLLIAGVVFILAGALLLFFARFGIPLGRLPGDFRFQSGNLTCIFPLASSLLISLLLTLLLNLLARFLQR